MLFVKKNYNKYFGFGRILVSIVFVLSIVTYYRCRRDYCRNSSYRYSSAAHHSRGGGGGGGCLNPYARIFMANGSKIPIKYIKKGDLVFSMRASSNKIFPSTVKQVFCHQDGPYKLWSIKGATMDDLFTENHPLLINGSWMAINTKSSFDDFGVDAVQLKNVTYSGKYLKEVCAVELEAEYTLAYNVEGFWFSD